MVKITNKDQTLLLPCKKCYRLVTSDNIKAISDPFKITDRMMRAAYNSQIKRYVGYPIMNIAENTKWKLTIIDGGKK